MIFTIDNDNDIRAHETEALAEETAKVVAGTIVVHNKGELSEATAEWPASRLVETWNSFAGVAPFTDCKPVKKFENRQAAVARIWSAIQRLGNAVRPKDEQAADAKPAENQKPTADVKPAAEKKSSKKAKATPKGAKAAKKEKKGKAAGKPREGTHKAEVIAMLQRKGGATLDQIVEATGWQKHTVRGFISILGSKHGMKVASSRREKDGARVYEA